MYTAYFESPIFFVALFIHIVSLITGFGAVIVVDTFGLLWLLKKIPLERVTKTAEITQRLIWIGWSGLVLSGTGLILMKGFVDELTMIKLFFVALLGLNGIFLHTIKKSMEKLANPNEITPTIMFRTALASTISQMGWWGALIIGFVHRHIEHNIPYPKNPWIYMVGILLAISIVAIIGTLITRKKS